MRGQRSEVRGQRSEVRGDRFGVIGNRLEVIGDGDRVSSFTHHLSPITYHLSPLTYYLLPITLYLFLILFPVITLGAEIKAYVDKDQVVLGESLQLMITVSGEEGTADLSAIKDFKVISRGTSTSVRIENNKMSREVTYNYTLIPLREGSLRIPPLPVTTNGTTGHTQEITVQVSKTSQQQEDTNSRDIFAEAQISNQNPYQGEQILYTLKFYNAVQIDNARFQKAPEFPDFTAKKVEKDRSYQTILSGRRYNVTELNYILIPLSIGEKIIEPAIISCDVLLHSSRRRSSPFDSIFNDPFFRRNELATKTFMSEPIIVSVKPLPLDEGNIEFSGLVGEFKIWAELEANTLKVGDSTTLSVIIQGTGNIMDATEPKVALSEKFKAYKDTPQEDILLTPSGYTGKKIFRSAIVPVEAGEYTFPQIQLRYFSIRNGEYETLVTHPISMTVNPAEQKEKLDIVSAAPIMNGTSVKKKVEFTGMDILPLKEDVMNSLKSQKSLPLIQFVAFLMIPAIFYMFVKTALIFTKKPDNPATIMAERANKALKEADKMESSSEAFFSALYRALVFAVLSKAGIKGESLTYTEAEKILRSNGYSDEIATNASKLLEKIESAKFSGVSIDKEFTKELLFETKQMVKHLS